MKSEAIFVGALICASFVAGFILYDPPSRQDITFHVPELAGAVDESKEALTGEEMSKLHGIEKQRLQRGPNCVRKLRRDLGDIVSVESDFRVKSNLAHVHPTPGTLQLWYATMIFGPGAKITKERARALLGEDSRMAQLFLASSAENVAAWIEIGEDDARRLLENPKAKHTFHRAIYDDALAWKSNEIYVQALNGGDEATAGQALQDRDDASAHKQIRFRSLLDHARS